MNSADKVVDGFIDLINNQSKSGNYCIYINGKMVVAYDSRGCWKSKSGASRGFSSSYKGHILRIAEEEGLVPPPRKWGTTDYHLDEAREQFFKEFKKHLIDKGILEFREV